jgi:hypothetical protein
MIRCVVTLAILLVAAILGSGPLRGADQQDVLRLVKEDLAIENAECGVFFATVAEGLRRSMPAGKERDKEVADWSKAGKDAFEVSRYLIGDQKSLAYIKLGTEKIKRMMNGTFDDLAIVQAEYAYRYKDLTDTPKRRWDYWMQKEMQTEKELQSAPK